MPQIACPACGAALAVPEDSPETSFRCPGCQKILRLNRRSRTAVQKSAPSSTASTETVAPSIRPLPETAKQTKSKPSVAHSTSLDASFSNVEEVETLTQRRQRSNSSTGIGAAHSLGIGSMVLGVVALLFSFIPCIGVFSMPLSGLGLLLGIIGGAIALSRSGHGIGFPIAGSAINGMALLIALFWLLLAGATHDALDKSIKETNATIPPRQPETAAPRQPETVAPLRLEAGPSSETSSDRNPKRSISVDWSMIRNSIETREISISAGPAMRVGFIGEKFGRILETRCLCVRIRVENKTRAKLIRWGGWQGEGKAEDEFGNVYRPHLPSFGLSDYDAATSPALYMERGGGRILAPDYFKLREDGKRIETCNWRGDSGGRISPGKVYLGILYIEPPIEAANEIRLSLPASAYEESSSETLRFRVPIIGKNNQAEQDAKKQRQQAGEEAAARREKESQRRAELAQKERVEAKARSALRAALQVASQGFKKEARKRYQEIIDKYPDTEAAAKAKKLLEKP